MACALLAGVNCYWQNVTHITTQYSAAEKCLADDVALGLIILLPLDVVWLLHAY